MATRKTALGSSFVFLPFTCLKAISFSPIAASLVRDAESLSAAGKYREAKAKLNEAFKKEKGREQRIDLRLRQFNLYLEAGKVQKGRELLRKMLNKVSEPPVFVALARALMYYHPLQRDEAKRLLEVALRKDGNNYPALLEMGYCYFYEGKLQEAAGQFEKAISVKEKYVTAYVGLADVQFVNGEADKAIATLERARSHAPKNAQVMKKMGDFYLASQDKDRITKAITSYDKAVGLGEGNPKYLASLMLAFFVRQTAGDAKPFYEKLRKINSDSTYVNWADGVFQELKGQVGNALKSYEEAVRKDPQNWLAHFSRANIYAGRGNVEYVRWAEDEKHRYSGHGNRTKATEAYEAIKVGAPTFPYIGVVNQFFAPGSEEEEEEEDANVRSRQTSNTRRRVKRSGRAVSSGMY